MKKIIIIFILGITLVSIGCSIMKDTYIACQEKMGWEGEYNDCQIWIKKIVDGYELGHSEGYYCENLDIESCCDEIKQHMKENKGDSVYYSSIENIEEIKCGKRGW